MRQRAASSGRSVPARRVAFDQTRHGIARQSGGRQRGVRPVAGADIEPQRAGCIRHLLDHLAGQPIADIGLGQQHLARRRANTAGSCLRTHSSLGAVKPGMAMLPVTCRRVGNVASSSAHSAAGANVVPQDGRPQHGAGLVQQHRAVHLAGQADALDRGQGRGVVAAQASMTSSIACHQACGSCSLCPGDGRCTDSGTVALPTTCCASSTSNALTAEVPKSRPRNRVYAPPVRRPADAGPGAAGLGRPCRRDGMRPDRPRGGFARGRAPDRCLRSAPSSPDRRRP